MLKSRLLSFILSLCSFISAGAHGIWATPDSTEIPEPVDTDYVYLLNADVIRFEEYINPDAQRLIGNVVFRHDSMYMYCDSALFYQKKNSFEQELRLYKVFDPRIYRGKDPRRIQGR